MEQILYFLISFLVGCSFGFAELLNRYYEEPLNILKVFGSYVYLCINGFASCLAYWILTDKEQLLNIQMNHGIKSVLIAGGAAMLILRSSIFNLKIGEQKIDIGFAAITDIFLRAADKSFDRQRAKFKLDSIKRIMNLIDFNKAEKDLPILCLNLMHNIPIEDQKKLGNEIRELSNSELVFNTTKSISLGLILSKITGLKLLEESVNSLGKLIKNQEQKEEASAYFQHQKEIERILKEYEDSDQ